VAGAEWGAAIFQDPFQGKAGGGPRRLRQGARPKKKKTTGSSEGVILRTGPKREGRKPNQKKKKLQGPRPPAKPKLEKPPQEGEVEMKLRWEREKEKKPNLSSQGSKTLGEGESSSKKQVAKVIPSRQRPPRQVTPAPNEGTGTKVEAWVRGNRHIVTTKEEHSKFRKGKKKKWEERKGKALACETRPYQRLPKRKKGGEEGSMNLSQA